MNLYGQYNSPVECLQKQEVGSSILSLSTSNHLKRNNMEKTDNELIAEFMGFKKVTVGYFGDDETEWQTDNREWMDKVDLNSVGDYAVDVQNDSWRAWESVKYHKSWNQLMPVVAKISEYRLAYPKESGWVCDCKIVVGQKYLYREVVNFIKFLNSHNKTT
jgi:hypothetical protein